MTDLREAAMMALEALEYENSWHLPRNEKPYVSTLEAIAALAAALASSCDEQRHELWESGGVAGCERARVAERQRDALLEALRRIAMASEATVCNQEWIAKTARAAIKAAEETK